MSSTSSSGQVTAQRSEKKPVTPLSTVTVRFVGDSGDGMQMAGTQFSDTSALFGNDIATLPDFPAEIRAPAGTVAGVSGYQIQFSDSDIYTPGDEVDALVAMNAAALKANLRSVKHGGIVIVNQDAFGPVDLKKAGYASHPLEDGSVAGYRLIKVSVDKLNEAAVKPSGLAPKFAARCKNFFALGLLYWLYDRPLESTLHYIEQKFARKSPDVAMANTLALKAGYDYGETSELLPEHYHVSPANLPPGRYRKVTGNDATALGLVTAAKLAGKELFYGSYPITPATSILESLAEMKNFGVVTFQAEDEICAMGSTVGAAFGGALAATGTSGPGVALKSEAMGLAVMTELPVVIVNVQRGGPSTGLPTKTEQSDLFQAVFGRNGECPIPVIAAASPSDCFDAAIEASRIALTYMTPVILLSDGYLANGAEPWLIPDTSKLEKITVRHPTKSDFPNGFRPYQRDANGVRPWALPGTPGLEHRVGGLEKQDITGTVSYDPANHDRMMRLRAKKVAGIKPVGKPWFWTGPEKGDVLVIGWGGTYGSIKAATLKLRAGGAAVSACQLRYINPMPAELGEMMKNFRHILVAELNLGQLCYVLRATFLIDAKSFGRVRGQPFTIGQIIRGVRAVLDGEEIPETDGDAPVPAIAAAPVKPSHEDAEG